MGAVAPLISLIVPVYNAEARLPRCIASALIQTYPNYEIILVDDGSIDGSGKYCDDIERIDKRVRTIHKANGGSSEARNVGIEAAKGEFVAFLDADDYVSSNYLEMLYADLVDTDSDIAVSQLETVKEQNVGEIGHAVSGSGSESCNLEVCTKYDALKKLLYDRGCSVSPCGKLYKSSLFEYVKYPVGMEYEDTEATYLLIRSSRRVSIRSNALYYYVLHDESKTHRQLSERSFDRYELARRVYNDAVNLDPSLTNGAKRFLLAQTLAVLRLRSDDEQAYSYRIKQLTAIARRYAGAVLVDSRSSARDKSGAASILLGRQFYLMCWSVYARATKRR